MGMIHRANPLPTTAFAELAWLMCADAPIGSVWRCDVCRRQFEARSDLIFGLPHWWPARWRIRWRYRRTHPREARQASEGLHIVPGVPPPVGRGQAGPPPEYMD